ncbi:MAG: restriction system protein [Candidatus Hydrogenedentes bacterium]|nr:restriction system protein [Candidatus Hydrogenedentota bacterium]
MPPTKQERDALLHEAKTIQQEYARLHGSDPESEARKELLRQRYDEVGRLLADKTSAVKTDSAEEAESEVPAPLDAPPAPAPRRLPDRDIPEIKTIVETAGTLTLLFDELKRAYDARSGVPEDLLIAQFVERFERSALDDCHLAGLLLAQERIRERGLAVGSYGLVFLRRKITHRYARRLTFNPGKGPQKPPAPSIAAAVFDRHPVGPIVDWHGRLAAALRRDLHIEEDQPLGADEAAMTTMFARYATLMGNRALDEIPLTAFALVCEAAPAFRECGVADVDGLKALLEQRHADVLQQNPVPGGVPSLPGASGPEAAFERRMTALLTTSGFEIYGTKPVADGLDALAYQPATWRKGKHVIHCRQTRSISEPAVRALFDAVALEGATRGLLIAEGRFTPSAKAFAEGKPIELIDTDILEALSKELGQDACKTDAVPDSFDSDPLIAQLRRHAEEQGETLYWRAALIDALTDAAVSAAFREGAIRRAADLRKHLAAAELHLAAMAECCESRDDAYHRFMGLMADLHRAGIDAIQGRFAHALTHFAGGLDKLAAFAAHPDTAELPECGATLDILVGRVVLNMANLCDACGAYEAQRRLLAVYGKAGETSIERSLTTLKQLLRDGKARALLEEFTLAQIAALKRFQTGRDGLVGVIRLPGVANPNDIAAPAVWTHLFARSRGHLPLLSIQADIVYGEYGRLLGIREEQARALGPDVLAKIEAITGAAHPAVQRWGVPAEPEVQTDCRP